VVPRLHEYRRTLTLDADDYHYVSMGRLDRLNGPARYGFPSGATVTSDFALIIGGNKACVLPPDQVAAVAPSMPAVSSAVYDAAHQELCPR
jgi:hypothetical protein